jgi:hypothetical protein
MMKVFLALKNVKCKNSRKRWDRERLGTNGTEFGNAVDKQIRRNKGSVDSRWETLKKTITTQAKRTIGFKKGVQDKKPWATDEMLRKMDERCKVKHQSTEQARKDYKRLNNKLRRETEKARECWWDKQCDELEELQRQGKQAQVYSKIQQMQKKSGKSGPSIKDKHGKLLTDEAEVRSRWKEYIEELYDKI